MAIFENADFCSIEEYFINESSRVSTTALKIDELYTAMYQLADCDKAGKQPVKLLDIETKLGKTAVRLGFLDIDLNLYHDSLVLTRNDYLDFPPNSDFGNKKTRYEIINCYLRDYFDDQFGRLLAQDQSLQLV